MKITKHLSLLVPCALLFCMSPAIAQTKPTPKPRITYTAVDSVRVNKDKSILSLYGAAQFDCKTFHVTADEIVYNKTTKKLSAKNFRLLNKADQKETSGVVAQFDVD